MTKSELNGATGFRLRRQPGGSWFLKLFNDAGKNVGDYGPLEWAETTEAIADVKRLGVVDIERDLGSRGK